MDHQAGKSLAYMEEAILCLIWYREGQQSVTSTGLDNYLYYAKSPSDSFLGFIDLTCAYIQAEPNNKFNKKNLFLIQTSDKRMYYLVAETEKDLQEYVVVVTVLI